MAEYTIEITTRVTGNDEVRVKVKPWKRDVVAGDEVTFQARGKSDADVTLIWKDGRSPFSTADSICVDRNGSPTAAYTVKDDVVEQETYQYAVTGRFSDGEEFAVDPRFVIGGG